MLSQSPLILKKKWMFLYTLLRIHLIFYLMWNEFLKEILNVAGIAMNKVLF